MLVHHFLGSYLGRGLLEDEGIESVRGLFFSIVAMLATIGLFLPRQFHALYQGISGATRYEQALASDTLFLYSLVFLIAVALAALVAPAMFPDDTDYLALMPLPLSRRQFFAAKVTALAAVAFTVVSSLTVLTSIAFPGFTHAPWYEVSLRTRILTHAVGSWTSGALGFGLVSALQGLLLVATPHRWLMRAQVLLQCTCLGGVVLLAPFVMSFGRPWVASEPDALFFVPPAWAYGVERALQGTATDYWISMASVGGSVLLGIVVVAVAATLLMYAHSERLILPPPPDRTSGDGRPPARSGVALFVASTMARNRLPLLLVLLFVSAGLSFLLGDITTIFNSLEQAPAERVRFDPALASLRFPMVMTLMGIAGLRMAFLVPVLSRANWIFRMTDSPQSRRAHLSVVDRSMTRWVLAPAIISGVVLQILVLKSAALLTIPLTMIIGLLMVEVALAGWRRVPFTCTWIPGQRPLVFILLTSAVALAFVARMLPAMVFIATRSWPWLLSFGVLVTTAAVSLRVYRIRTWADLPLQFEDERYDKVQVLGLTR
jgi:hypothetical protein